MHDIESMNVLDASNDLLEESTRVSLLDAGVLDDVVEEFSSDCVLHDEVELFGRFDDLIQLNDIWVPDQLQNVDLASYTFNVRHVADAVLFQYLDSDLLTRQCMHAQLNLPECTLPNAPSKSVVANCLL